MLKLTIFIMIGSTLFLFWRITKTRAVRREVQMLKAYRTSMEMIYTGMEERLGLVRKYRHDLKNHILLLEELSNKRTDIHGLDDFVEHQKNIYSELNEHHFVRDEIIDTLLHLKSQECEEKGIPCEIKVEDGIYAEYDPTDLVTLIMNLFDNAIEENMKIKEKDNRGIDFSMNFTEDSLCLLLTNRIRKGKIITFRTQKKDGIHGLGMKIIQEVIDLYHGERNTQVDTKEGKLTDNIILRSR